MDFISIRRGQAIVLLRLVGPCISLEKFSCGQECVLEFKYLIDSFIALMRNLGQLKLQQLGIELLLLGKPLVLR